jgi:hypothetical protein
MPLVLLHGALVGLEMWRELGHTAHCMTTTG